MSSSGFTPQFLTALEEAIAQGVLTLSYEGKTVTYRSLPDMLETRKLIRRELGLDRGRRRKPVRLVAGRWS
jgi:hypothetical protein